MLCRCLEYFQITALLYCNFVENVISSNFQKISQEIVRLLLGTILLIIINYGFKSFEITLALGFSKASFSGYTEDLRKVSRYSLTQRFPEEPLHWKSSDSVDLCRFFPCFPAFFDLLISLGQQGLIIILHLKRGLIISYLKCCII